MRAFVNAYVRSLAMLYGRDIRPPPMLTASCLLCVVHVITISVDTRSLCRLRQCPNDEGSER